MRAYAHGDRTMLDAAQNVSGWVRLTVRGTTGDTVTIRHAEVLEPSGDLHVAALRSAKATDVYILDRDGEHVLEPAFTFHGFRYADVVGAEVVSAEAVAISSDLAPRSAFHSSHPALDQFHSNVFWSQRDNFVSVPTDCPQRDERLGWTGDAQAFSATAATLMDSESFWASWLRDLEIDQTDEGGVPAVVPDMIRPVDMLMGGVPTENMGRAGWADAATIVPLAVYESYGSDEILVRQLDSMRRWVEHLRRRAGDGDVLPTEPFQFGDWLDPDAPGDRPWEAKVSSDFVANAFYVRSARLLAQAELLVGDPGRAAEYAALADRVAVATFERWGDEAVTTQTGAALTLEFELCPPDRRDGIAAALAADVRRENGRIATGFLGTPLVLFALSHNGYLDEAYLMLLRRDAPSWLYQVDRGATTVWERWDAILPDGSIHSGAMDALPSEEADREEGSMLSFNHYAYGAMIDWVYRTVGGLAPDLADPGYRTMHVAPRPAAGLDRASASIDTRLGRAGHRVASGGRWVRGDPRRAVRCPRRPRPAGHRRLDRHDRRCSGIGRSLPWHAPDLGDRTCDRPSSRRRSRVTHHRQPTPEPNPPRSAMTHPIARVVVDAPYRSDTVASAEPIIGWITETDAADWGQARAELQLDRDGSFETHGVEGSASTQIAWPFAPLAPRDDVDAARTRDRRRRRAGAVERAAADLRRIPRATSGTRRRSGSPTLPNRRSLPTCAPSSTCSGPVARATLYATAVGVYQVALNGADVDDQVMKPGWTPFQYRTIHETTDVTGLLDEGRNAIGVRLAGGWGTEHFGFRENSRLIYGDQPRFAAQLLIEYVDGTSEWLRTDAAWRASTGPITASGLYDGEHFDARRALVR